jgi:hypothetical protein
MIRSIDLISPQTNASDTMIPTTHQLLILTYAVLSGLSLLVPLPYLDDWLRNQLTRRMVRDLAKLNNLELTPEEIKILGQGGDGCLAELLHGFIWGPVKRVVRDVVFVLEWRRAVNTVSQVYYEGFLLDYLFLHKVYRRPPVRSVNAEPTPVSGVGGIARALPISTGQASFRPAGDLIYASRVRRAVLFARQRANTRVVAQAVKISFNHSRDLIRPVMSLIYHFLGEGVVRGSDGVYLGLRRWLFPAPRRAAADPQVADAAAAGTPVPPAVEKKTRPGWRIFSYWGKLRERLPEHIARENLSQELGIEKLKANQQVGELVGIFAQQFSSIPQEHFEGMCATMLAELGLRLVRNINREPRQG